MVIRGRPKRTMPPSVPKVRKQNLFTQLGQALGQIARSLRLERRQKRIDPSKRNQPHRGLKRTRPMPTDVWWIFLNPILKPIESEFPASAIPQQPAGLSQPHGAVPTAWLPKWLDRSARWQLPVIEIKRNLARRDIDSGLVITLPVWRRIHRDVHLPVKTQLAFGDPLGVCFYSFMDGLRSVCRIG